MTFMKRLRVEGDNCEFKIHQDNIVRKESDPGYIYFNYYMIKLKIMHGLQDQFIKQKVITLYQKEGRTSLDNLFKKVMAWETARKAAEIGGESSNGAYAGGGNRAKRDGKKSDSCMNCGEKCHPGGNSEAVRKDKCKAYGKACGRCKQPHHFTKVCKVAEERLPEVLARKGARYKPPAKDGKPPPGKKRTANVNAGEADTTDKEPSAAEVKLQQKLDILQARMDSILPDPTQACVSAWMPQEEKDFHVNAVSATTQEETHQPPLTYAGAARRAIEPVEGGQRSITNQRTPVGQTLGPGERSITGDPISRTAHQQSVGWLRRSTMDAKDGYHGVSLSLPTLSDSDLYNDTPPLTDSESDEDYDENEEEEEDHWTCAASAGEESSGEDEDPPGPSQSCAIMTQPTEEPPQRVKAPGRPGLLRPGLTHDTKEESSEDEESSDDEEPHAQVAVSFSLASLKQRIQKRLNRGKYGTLQHQVWDPKTDWWKVCNTVNPHAKLDISISIHQASYAGRKVPILPGYNVGNMINTKAVLDSGAQITIIPRCLVEHMGVDMSNMDKSKMKIRSIDNSRVLTQGALCLNITAKTNTRWINVPTMVYVIPNASGIFLDLQTMENLGLIEDDFPRPKASA